jgi:hypothetical protein
MENTSNSIAAILQHPLFLQALHQGLAAFFPSTQGDAAHVHLDTSPGPTPAPQYSRAFRRSMGVDFDPAQGPYQAPHNDLSPRFIPARATSIVSANSNTDTLPVSNPSARAPTHAAVTPDPLTFGNRDGWSYPPSTARVRAQREHPNAVYGTHWYKFNVDVYHTQVNADTVTQQPPPWLAIRPDFGLIRNHPVELMRANIDKESFLASFHGEIFQTRNLKDFTQNFPSLQGNGTNRDLLQYLNDVSNYCAGYAFYAVPITTYQPGKRLGAWFPFLPARVQSSVASNFASTLRDCLHSKHSGLRQQPRVWPQIQFETNGYEMAYTIAIIAEHPLLLTIPIALPFPRQQETDTLAMYTSHWQHFFLIEILNGIFYSDRFFLEMFFQGLYKTVHYRDMIDYLRSTVMFHNTGDRIHAPLPDLLVPNNLLTTIQQYCTSQRASSLCVHSPKDIIKSRRDRFAIQSPATSQVQALSFPPIHQVFQLSSSVDTDISDAPLSADEDQALLCHALASRPSGCFWCGNDAHQLSKCPLASTALNNPSARKVIRSWLTPRDTTHNRNHTSSASSSRTAGTRLQHVRALTFEDDSPFLDKTDDSPSPSADDIVLDSDFH